jgi:hypothetical protein
MLGAQLLLITEIPLYFIAPTVTRHVFNLPVFEVKVRLNYPNTWSITLLLPDNLTRYKRFNFYNSDKPRVQNDHLLPVFPSLKYSAINNLELLLWRQSRKEQFTKTLNLYLRWLSLAFVFLE